MDLALRHGGREVFTRMGRNRLIAVFTLVDAAVVILLAYHASTSLFYPACRAFPDYCAQVTISPSPPVSPPLAAFVLGSEVLLVLFVGLSGLPDGAGAAKFAVGLGLGGVMLMIFASSRSLMSLVPSLTPYQVYSILTAPFVADPSRYSDATGLYYGLTVYDVEGMLLLSMALGAVFVLYRAKGKLFAVLRVARVAAMLACFLAVDVAVFDYGEFFLHATAIQDQLHAFTWFTNADLLFAGLSVGAAALVLERRSKLTE